MSTTPTVQNVDIKPPFAGLAGLSILAWVVLSFLGKYDEEKHFFIGVMFLSGLLAAYHLRYARKNKNPIQGGAVVAFVIVWLGIFSIINRNREVQFLDYSIELGKVGFMALLPLVTIWIQPYKDESFFGIMELEENDKLHAIWRDSVLLIVLINILKSGDHWYWGALEFVILIPMLYETVQLQKHNSDELPVLTLFIQTEIANKFAVPFSMLKSVFLIMVAFIFELLESRFWLLVILGYFAAGFIWGVFSIIPEDMRSKSDGNGPSEIEKIFSSGSKASRKDQRRRKRRRGKKGMEDEPSISINLPDRDSIVSTIKSDIETDTSLQVISPTVPVEVEKGSIQEKAHSLGKQVRTGMEKPYYTLNHILSTLKAEDFSEAWKVNQEGLIFSSTRGKWSPPKGLILFPIELEKYDYRRKNQILLLGFNKPLQDEKNKVKLEFGTSSKYNAKISDNAIQFGDVTFNTRSLIVSIEEWTEIQSDLELVTQTDDISYTGFKTLNQMQEVLASLSEKWIELRLTAQEAAVNFLAGLLGATEPIFIPREGLESPKFPEIEGIVEAEDIVNDLDLS
ncbi:MAG: hypothetical protein ACW99Q_17835 [Candidatus Kariarchaeaceae archaeon]|jgi:hypothetical protein